MRRLVTLLFVIPLLGAVATHPGRQVPALGSEEAGAQPALADSADPAAESIPWRSTTLHGARDIVAAHDRFVVVGEGGKRTPFAKAWVSTDGLAWTRAPDSKDLRGAGMTHVISTDDGFVALGTDEYQLIAAWRSPDGLAWDRVPVKRNGKRGLEASIYSVVDGPGGLIALGVFTGQDYGGHRMWHSTDGWLWTPIKTPKLQYVSALVAIPGGYWLIGHDGGGSVNAYWRSRDGTKWQRLEGMPWLRDAAVNDDGSIAGIGVADIWSSDDLEDWELVWPLPEGSFDEAELYWIEWDGSRFVTTGNVAYGYLECLDGMGWCPQEPWLTSEDGRTWLESSGPDGLPGPDRETYLAGSATLGEHKVMLGRDPEGRAASWSVPDTAASAAATERRAAEDALRTGITPWFRSTCKPKRASLPEAALASVICWPGVGPFRLRYYYFEDRTGLLDGYDARLVRSNHQRNDSGPGRCRAGRSTDGPLPGSRDAAVETRRAGCFIDGDGQAHYLVISPPHVLTEFIGRKPDERPSYATVREWVWDGDQDV